MLLGGFDGLHLGHRRLLSRAKESALSVGVMSIVGGKDGGIFTEEERELIFKEAGADFLFSLPFTEIKTLSPTQFIDILTEKFSPKLYVCGEDFRFGANAEGTPQSIKGEGQVCVEILPLVTLDGEKISSRTVKRYLSAGEMEKANASLGQPFFLVGKVEEDRRVGRSLGFPTANIVYPQEKYPLKEGVYETRVTVDGKAYRGITNFGARPTFDDDRVLTETHLDGFDGDLYGRELRVEFIRRLRDIKKFDGAEALKKQLQEDIRRVRTND